MAKTCTNLGLIGWPLEHSLSPRIHHAALKALGICGDYRLFAIPPEEHPRQAILSLLEHLQQGSMQGLNVTLPYKQTVLTLLEALTPAAAQIGAVNTIYKENERLTGDNTDAPGFQNDLRHLPVVPGVPALVLGAGGAARAVVFSLLKLGHPVILAARRPAAAQSLADALKSSMEGSIRIIPYQLLAIRNASKSIGLLVNTTPVGMHPDTAACPWPEDLTLPAQAAVYDLVYNPPETRLLQWARQAGLPARGGLGMLVEQAALAFERWTGLPAPRPAMQQAAETAYAAPSLRPPQRSSP